MRFPKSACRALRWTVALWLFAGAAVAAAASAHPLDPLDAREIEQVVQILRAAGHADEGTRFAAIHLHEPAKDEVWAWTPGAPVPRVAEAVLVRDGRVHEAEVDLASAAVREWREVPGAVPAVAGTEWGAAVAATKADPRWRAAMQERGIDTFEDIHCIPVSAGYFGRPGEQTRRTVRVFCFDVRQGRGNVYSRPIEGVHALVDLDLGTVAELVDTGPVTLPTEVHGLSAEDAGVLREALKPVLQLSPGGSNFTVTGHEIRWDNWQFHLKVDRRLGPVLSLIQIRDGEKWRPLAYQFHLSELFVPYMDASEGWYFRTYLDAADFGLGMNMLPLAPGIDCPLQGHFMDATVAGDDGRALTLGRVLCIFERGPGDPLWRHASTANRTLEGVPAVELVVRGITTLGNYDYVLDWVFTQGGAFGARVGATGITLVKGVQARRQDDGTGEDLGVGPVVAPHLVAVYHDHFLSYRLDLDIDGRDNTLFADHLVPHTVTGPTPRSSLWSVQSRAVTEAGPLGQEHGPVLWRIANENRTTALGHHPGYVVRAGHGAVSLLAPDDWPQRRAGFSAAPLWITPYAPGQIHAAGRYPNQGRGEDSLPEWAQAAGAVRNIDIVLWPTVGFHHVTRAEDWPVLNTAWHGFMVEPFNFFTRNPALDVPREFRRRQ